MMSDDTEERQLSGLIDVLVPFTTTSKSTGPGAERDRTPRSPRWAHPRVLPEGRLKLSIADWLAASPFNRRPRNDPVETRPAGVASLSADCCANPAHH